MENQPAHPLNPYRGERLWAGNRLAWSFLPEMRQSKSYLSLQSAKNGALKQAKPRKQKQVHQHWAVPVPASLLNSSFAKALKVANNLSRNIIGEVRLPAKFKHSWKFV